MSSRKKATRSPAKLSRQAFRDRFEEMVSNIGRVIKGKDDVVRMSLTCLLANGHILFEDMPGTGKTMLARSIAQTINAESSRIQCTPDLLPADVTGSPVLDRKTGDFIFRPGPVFASVFLADEINRASPKTQASLLEAMAERNVTVDGVTHPLPRPFFVLATQNPIELAGTFPLPEAQLDRFLFKLSLGYMDTEAEIEVLDTNRKQHSIESLEPVVDTAEVIAMMEWCTEVSCSDPVKRYMVELVQGTRNDPALLVGASARATMSLFSAARVLAASQGRDDVLPDDVKRLAMPVLAHRMLLTPDAMLREDTVEQVVERLVTRVKIPTGAGGRQPAAATA
ncbi:MAG TPA: MoxR family ATPase [Actinomycetota bacterium]|nr:MoxR family ATPase [Actinomycetota bacterium]